MGFKWAAIAAGIISLATAAAAQSPPPEKLSASPTATLYRVDEGLFDLKVGQSIDLTDRKILLHFNGGWNQSRENLEQKYISLSISGRTDAIRPGNRWNLKNIYELQKTLNDKDQCFLDLIDVLVPKGAQAIATFRFSCD